MSKGTRRISGFLWAMVIAVVSFFIIFLFFPDVSGRYLGVSLKSPKSIGTAVESAGANVKDTIKDAASNVVDTAVTNVTNKVTDAVNDAISSGISDLAGGLSK